MTNNRSRLIESAVVVLAALALTLVAAQLTSAQKPTPAPPPETRPHTAPNDTDPTANFERELQLLRQVRIAEQHRKRSTAQLEMDFLRLEQLNDEQIAPVLRATSPDYQKLSLAAAEIKDCATRIKYGVTLSLKKKGEKIRYDARANELGSLLPELNSVIKSFTANPVFHQRDRNDAELRSAAGHDLEGIIKLSGAINKMAKRLAKAPTQSSR